MRLADNDICRKEHAAVGFNSTFSKHLLSASAFRQNLKIGIGEEYRLKFESAREINTVILCEKGSHCASFSVFGEKTNGERVLLYENDVIDRFLYCAFPKVKLKSVIVKINQSDNGKPVKITCIDAALHRNENKDFRISVYFPTHTGSTYFTDHSQDKELDRAFDLITDAIVIGNARLRPDATLDYDPETLKRELAAMRRIIGERRVRIWCCIFPTDRENMVRMIRKNPEKLLNTILTYCSDYGFQGIDFDWEYPILPHAWHAFGKLLQMLKNALNGRDVPLAAAMSPWGVQLNGKAKDCLDFVNVMAYDWHKKNKRRHHSEFYSCHVYCAEYFKKLRFSDQQIFVGIPFYGKTFNNNDFLFRSYNLLEVHSNAQNTAVFEDREYYFNGYHLVYSKTAYNLDMGFGGVMIFAGCDDVPRDTGLSLYEAVESALKDRMDSC